MKNMECKEQTLERGSNYEAPRVEVLEVAIEKGFQVSVDSYNNPWGENGWGTDTTIE